MESFRPNAEEPRFEPGATIANYVIEELLGQGSEGSVFVARDTLLGRKVAMKTLRVADVGETRGVEEARLLATLDHPNIVRVYHARRHQGVWYVVYEYLRGGSVQSLIDRVGPLPLEQALDFAAQAAAGLSFAHRQGILHRDIKPQNLLLNGRGELKLADFGLAFDARGQRRAQTLVGTPAFLAPEVWHGEPATSASDVFSLGACLFLLLSGRLPFVGNNKEQLQQAQVELSPKFPPGLPLPVAELLSRMFAKEPTARPDSQALPRALQELAAAPYAAPAGMRQDRAFAQVKSPFSSGGPERALREALRSGRDAAYVSELSDLLAGAVRGVEICAPTPADGLLLLDVAREVGDEERAVAARLTLSKPRATLAETIERQLTRCGAGTFADCCAELLRPVRLLGTGALIVLHAPRGLSAEQQREVSALAEMAVDVGALCVLTRPLPEADDAEPPLPGFARMLAFGVAEPARELEERLKLWLCITTAGKFRFSTDAVRLAAHYCRTEGRYWANLALQSLLIASAAQLEIVTSWAVAGARAQSSPWYDPREVPAAWRKRPLNWPTPSMASALSCLRVQAASASQPLLSEATPDLLAV